MSNSNFLIGWLKSLFRWKRATPPPASDPIIEPILTEEEKAEKARQKMKALIKSLNPILVEKIVRLRNGENLIAKMFCDNTKTPITIPGSVGEETHLFYRLLNPTMIKRIHALLPDGRVAVQQFFEDWVENSNDNIFPVNINDVACVTTPNQALINSYSLYVIKSHLYRTYPNIAKNLFEYVIHDTPANYNIDMDEVEPPAFDDGYDNQGAE